MKPRALATLVFVSLASFGALFLGGCVVAPTVKLTPTADRVRVEVGGELFTEYIFGDGASRPYCYPVIAPDGMSLTRDFPMKQTPGEETDHKWHRALFFAHSYVNNVDFWNEAGGDVGKSPDAKGHQVLDTLLETTSGPVGILRARNRWLAPDGKLICTDDRTIRFHADADGRFIDYEVTLHALPDTPLLLGDNKDGTMAIRVAQWMTLNHEVDLKDVAGKVVKGPDGKALKTPVAGVGHIVTANGDRDKDAWGKKGGWCDYYAPRNGKIYGVALFDSPQNFRPTWWMAREWGLFGANPFGQHDYEKLENVHAGDHTVPAGGSLTLRYRFFFHYGDEKTARVAEHYADYVAGK